MPNSYTILRRADSLILWILRFHEPLWQRSYPFLRFSDSQNLRFSDSLDSHILKASDSQILRFSDSQRRAALALAKRRHRNDNARQIEPMVDLNGLYNIVVLFSYDCTRS